MKLLVHEHVTGGGMAGEPLPSSLASEAELMVSALAAELAGLEGWEIPFTRDPRLPPLAGVPNIFPLDSEPPAAFVDRALASADAVWLTAPETGGVLESLALAVIGHQKVLVGSSPDAVRVAASKRRMVECLRSAGVPVVPTFSCGETLPHIPGCWVVKPDDGAGSDGVRRVADRDAAHRGMTSAPGLVAQPWLDGDSRSLSLLVADGRAAVLSVNRQHVELRGGDVHLAALVVNAFPVVPAHESLASRVAASLPGLRGYVGVDLIDTEQGQIVLEVNPRLTTSYVGLGPALGVNVATMVLQACETGQLPTIRRTDTSVAVDLAAVRAR